MHCVLYVVRKNLKAHPCFNMWFYIWWNIWDDTKAIRQKLSLEQNLKIMQWRVHCRYIIGIHINGFEVVVGYIIQETGVHETKGMPLIVKCSICGYVVAIYYVLSSACIGLCSFLSCVGSCLLYFVLLLAAFVMLGQPSTILALLMATEWVHE